MIQAFNDIMLALVLHRLHRRRFNVAKEDPISDALIRYDLDCGGYKIEAVSYTGGTVRICGPNNEVLAAAFDPYSNRAESLWLAQTIKDRIKEQKEEQLRNANDGI